MVEKEKDAELVRMKYVFGAEGYYFSEIGHASDIRKLCISSTGIRLLEMLFCQWINVMYEDIVKLLCKQELMIKPAKARDTILPGSDAHNMDNRK